MGQLNFACNFPSLPNNWISVLSASNSVQFFGFNFNDNISLNTINIPLDNEGVNLTITISLGLYSLTGSTLSIANSASGSLAINGGVRRYQSITAISATQNITPGTWYFGILASVTGTSLYLIAGSSINPNNAFQGNFIGGNMTDSTNALPSTFATSNLDITGSREMSVPYILISA